jgi:acetyl-CoA acetyltransferase
MNNDPIVIVGAARTPMGAFQGDFSSKSASDLGAVAIQAAVERAGAPGAHQGGPAGVDRRRDPLQDVRLGDAGRDLRP